MERKDVTLERAIRRLNARAWGISVGLVAGLGILIATNFLILKGGDEVGKHLILLREFFPGYSVTFIGSLIGFVYAFVIGYGLGRVIGMVYNKLVQST